MDFNSLQTWTGSRDDLVEILSFIEGQDSKRFGLFSKSSGKPLPIKKTRVQRLIELGVLPGPNYSKSESTKGAKYDWQHILHYLAAIVARKSGLTFEQISGALKEYNEDDLFNAIKTGTLPQKGKLGMSDPTALPNAKRKADILTSLDRKEGKALQSEQMLIAVTPWLHVHVSKKQLKRLGSIEIDVVSETIKDALTDLASNHA